MTWVCVLLTHLHLLGSLLRWIGTHPHCLTGTSFLLTLLAKVEGWIMAFKDIKVLIPGPCEYYLLWQKELANVIKLKILRWEDYPGLSKWVLNVITSPYKGTAEGNLTTEELGRRWYDDRSNERFEVVMPLALEIKDRTKSQGMKKL